MLIECKLDGKYFDSVKELHGYLKQFKLAQHKYYHEYYPRRDLMTGEMIEYKDYDQYFSQDFLTKENLKVYLKSKPEEGKAWAINYLKRRKEDKGLIYAPSQVDLRCLFCPTTHYFDKVCADQGGYYGITKTLGYKDRFTNERVIFSSMTKDVVAIQDTREQNPIKLSLPTIEQCLKVGDYGLAEPYDQKIYIDRKSLNDWAGTLSVKGFERFDRELTRAEQSGSYVVMIVENRIDYALNYQDLGLSFMRHVKASPEYLFHQLRTLLAKYPTCFQALFVNGRTEMADKIVKIFQMGNQVRKIDLQYAYEKGEL